MTNLFLILFGMTIGLSGGVVLTALMFAAKQADNGSEEDFKNLGNLKSI